MGKIRLFQFENCPYCQKVRDTLKELGLEYEKIEVPKDRAERGELLEVSGQYMVPVLVDDQTVVCDSAKIITYLKERY